MAHTMVGARPSHACYLDGHGHAIWVKHLLPAVFIDWCIQYSVLN